MVANRTVGLRRNPLQISAMLGEVEQVKQCGMRGLPVRVKQDDVSLATKPLVSRSGCGIPETGSD